MKKLLVPIDGSPISIKAVMEAKKLAEALGSDVVLLTVANITTPSGTDESNLLIQSGLEVQAYVSQFKLNAERHLAEAREMLKDLTVNVETVLLYGDPADQIAGYLDENEVEMVIMGSQGVGISRLRQVFIGSVTSKIVRHSKQPVLVVK
ncbi:universal stress protein [uncultured Acetobacterium sp.]|jgi:nucleotide-binding universal stress UspA family protein|uniref:universal stress protein n=1 Tax=uncultured Acetobacterium sp. TaxID=217139 RepID=UPI00242551B7|nr:universal stress protein [uncultured Acetobacterium sp.]MBU4540290.1 universal stress protein [Bacillota bacterium]